jgi:hypothetical protein
MPSIELLWVLYLLTAKGLLLLRLPLAKNDAGLEFPHPW